VASGLGTVVGVTVDAHPWDPAFPPPYVVANVALDEDPRARIISNLVDLDPADAAVGMRVEVRFEHVDDVWLPVFAPLDEPPAVELPPDDVPAGDHPRLVRPMLTTRKFEDDVVLSGMGMSEVGRRLMRPALSLTVEAVTRAIDDAGLDRADIDGLSTYPGMGTVPGMGEGGIPEVADALGIRPTWYNGGQDTFGPAGSVIAAMLAVSAGLARHVVCFRTVWQSTFTELLRSGRMVSTAQANGIPAGGRASGDWAWLTPYGVGSAALLLALPASNHFHRYGTTRETLGWIALNARRNAALNPQAIYTDPMTMDDYLSARPITTPFGLLDCDVPCDGAVAVIVSAADTASDLACPTVRVEAVGTAMTERSSFVASTTSHEPQTLGPSAHLWSRTDLKPADVDVAQLYDGFTFNCLSWIEALGFCGIGEAKDFLDGGHNIALDGMLPINTSGGQLSSGRLHGMGLVHEAIVQLRGEGGARQVADARTAVVTSGGLSPAGAMLLRRDA
jgi:acetyl-CoA acetyltransferase